MITAEEDGIEHGIGIGTVKGREEERAWLLDLLDQGLSAAEIRQQLAGR
jgi:hypothetical protein